MFELDKFGESFSVRPCISTVESTEGGKRGGEREREKRKKKKKKKSQRETESYDC